jgi:hypothetical protein
MAGGLAGGGACIVVDEATARRHPTLTAQWGLVDEGPEVATGDDHATGHVYGAVAPLTGRPHDHVSPAWGTGACAPFWPQLWGSHPGQRLLVSHDRGEQPKGAPVEALGREAQGPLRRKAQAASSPELKPQEHLWTWWRRVVTPHHGLATLTEHIAASRQVFRALAAVNEHVQHLCGLKTQESFVASL